MYRIHGVGLVRLRRSYQRQSGYSTRMQAAQTRYIRPNDQRIAGGTCVNGAVTYQEFWYAPVRIPMTTNAAT